VRSITTCALLALQSFHVLFLALHDWIPLGTLNDVKAVRQVNPGSKLLTGTLISLAPFAIGLAASIIYFGSVYPAWLIWWLWISYGLLFAGELTAWWIPYLFRRARRPIQGDVRRDARFPTRTQRHPPKYAACDPSRRNSRDIGSLSRAHSSAKMALTPGWSDDRKPSRYRYTKYH
jgi:hypothetical protein